MNKYYVVHKSKEIMEVETPYIGTIISADMPVNTKNMLFFKDNEQAKAEYFSMFDEYIDDLKYNVVSARNYAKCRNQDWSWDTVLEYENVDSIIRNKGESKHG